jgi:predicted metal-binding protein
MIRKIAIIITDEQLQKDLKKYRQRALELGATDVKIITPADVVISERVLAKCTYPKCRGYGTSANCPPHAMRPDQVRKVVDDYRYALFIKLDSPSEELAGSEPEDKRNAMRPVQRKLSEIIAKIEAEAFYDGYPLALAFGFGSCKVLFCPKIDCSALTPGQACVQGLKARSSMEAVGMDVCVMARNVGWDIYPIGQATLPSEVPCVSRMAVVLIE